MKQNTIEIASGTLTEIMSSRFFIELEYKGEHTGKQILWNLSQDLHFISEDICAAEGSNGVMDLTGTIVLPKKLKIDDGIKVLIGLRDHPMLPRSSQAAHDALFGYITKHFDSYDSDVVKPVTIAFAVLSSSNASSALTSLIYAASRGQVHRV